MASTSKRGPGLPSPAPLLVLSAAVGKAVNMGCAAGHVGHPPLAPIEVHGDQGDPCWLLLCKVTKATFTGDFWGGPPLKVAADQPLSDPALPGARHGAAGAREKGAEEGNRDSGGGDQEGGMTPDTPYGLGLWIPKAHLTAHSVPQPAGLGEGWAVRPGPGPEPELGRGAGLTDSGHIRPPMSPPPIPPCE